MLYNIEYDHGDSLGGYLIPDGFSDVPYVSASDDDGELGVFPCVLPRPGVALSGRHQSGVVVFHLDASHIPNLAARPTLRICEAKTGLLIYRRPPIASPIPLKIIRLETQLIPMIKFDRYCGSFFHYELFSVERFGHETTLQAFMLNAVDSIYLSGRLLMQNYANFLGKGFEGIIMLSDPYYDMALRIFLLKRMTQMPVPFLGDRDKLILGRAAAYFSDINLDDQDDFKARLKKAPPEVVNVLSSPVIRQLATSSPDQRIKRSDIAPAIDLLSRFTVVGHNSDVITFQNAVSELFGIAPGNLVVPPRQSLIEDIADKLRAIPVAEIILEEDLIFDHYVRQAMTTASPQMRSMNAE